MISRGRDATGYGTLCDNGDLFVFKGPVSATVFKPEFLRAEIPVGRIGLIHTRGASVGHPANNANNHPVDYTHGDRCVITVHNGTIGNLTESYSRLGVSPPAEVDSALISTALAVLGPEAGLKFLEAHSAGSATFASLFHDGTFVLVRETNPLYVGIPAPGAIVWGSTIWTIRSLCLHSHLGFTFPRVWEVEDRHYWLWGPDGELRREGRFELPFLVSSTAPNRLSRVRGATRTVGDLLDDLTGSAWDGDICTTPTDRSTVLPPIHNPPPALPAPATTPTQTESANVAPVAPVAPAHPAVDNPTVPGEPVRIVQPTDRRLRILCRWGGCWSPAVWSCRFETTFVPLCGTHRRKLDTKRASLQLTRTGELLKRQEH